MDAAILLLSLYIWVHWENRSRLYYEIRCLPSADMHARHLLTYMHISYRLYIRLHG
jgi:hypothetical protein